MTTLRDLQSSLLLTDPKARHALFGLIAPESVAGVRGYRVAWRRSIARLPRMQTETRMSLIAIAVEARNT